MTFGMYPFDNAEEKAAFQARTVQEVLDHHFKSLSNRNVAEYIKDYSDDCIFLCNPLGGHASGTYIGPAGIAKWCEEFFPLFNHVEEFNVSGAFMHGADQNEGVILYNWTIDNPQYTVTGGSDTIFIDKAQYRMLTAVYTVAKKV